MASAKRVASFSGADAVCYTASVSAKLGGRPGAVMSLFEGRNLACRRGERLVFSGLDFALAPGRALVLTGPNGSGKSSLLRVMAGMLPPAGGDLLWDGAAVREEAESHRARLHFVGHLDAVKPVLSVRENLRVWAALKGGGAESAPALESALETLALEALAEVPARLLSAGQKRRLALSRLFASPAALWLLDEPTVGLDARACERLVAAMARHLEGGGRIVVSTHLSLGLEGAALLSLEPFSSGALHQPDGGWVLGDDWRLDDEGSKRPEPGASAP